MCALARFGRAALLAKVAKGKAHVKAKVHVKVIEVQKRDKDSREKGMVKDTKCQVKDMVGQAKLLVFRSKKWASVAIVFAGSCVTVGVVIC